MATRRRGCHGDKAVSALVANDIHIRAGPGIRIPGHFGRSPAEPLKCLFIPRSVTRKTRKDYAVAAVGGGEVENLRISRHRFLDKHSSPQSQRMATLECFF